jgi:tetratricopeptide (TPR) repeat protein
MLVCIAGPASGQEFPLDGDEVVIGRASDNPVSVPDTSVSRKHALLRKTESGWAVSDLGSGNGTMLNGEAIADETQLNDGDTIALGDSEFTFKKGGGSGPVPKVAAGAPATSGARRPPVKTARSMGGAEAAPPGRARPKTSRMAESPEEKAQAKKKRFVAFGAVAVVLLALLVGWKAISSKKEKARIAQMRAQKEHDDEASAMLQEAKNFARQAKWVEAKKKLEELREFDADYESKSVDMYLQRAEKEIPNQRAMGEAEKAIKAGEVGKATQLLDAVKTFGVDQEQKKGDLKVALDEAITKKLADTKMLLTATNDLSKMETAKANAEDVLVARPDDREAPEYKKLAEQAINYIKNPKSAPPPPDNSDADVRNRFRQGDVNGAASLAEACLGKNAQCKKLFAQIKEYQAKSKNLDGLKDDDLMNLFELDKTIGGGTPSEQSKPIKTRLAANFYMKASSAKMAGQWSRAIDMARKVLAADPGHAGANNIISEARSAAKDQYLRAYQLKDTSPDEAAKLFKDVLMMTPKDDEYHQKAEMRLNELNSK